MKQMILLISLLFTTNSFANMATEKVCAFYQDYGIHVPQVRKEVFGGSAFYKKSNADYVNAIKKNPLVKDLILQAMIAFGTDAGSQKTSWDNLIIENGPDSSGRDLTVYKLSFEKDALIKVGATKRQAETLASKKHLYYIDHGRGDNGMGTVVEHRGYLEKRALSSVIATGGDNDFSSCPYEYMINYNRTEK